MKFIYDHIIYAELNTKSDYCQVCGWDGEIEVVEEDGKLIWKCPQCGNTDQDKMNVARRTCGYIGTTVLESGADAGDQGPRPAPVISSVFKTGLCPLFFLPPFYFLNFNNILILCTRVRREHYGE